MPVQFIKRASLNLQKTVITGNFAGSAELSVYDLGHVSFIGAQPEHWGEDVSKFLQRL